MMEVVLNMRRFYFLLFIVVISIFLIYPKEAEAKTRCKYHWIDPLHEGQTEDSIGNPITTEADFILETEDDDNKLTRIISPFTKKPAVFANGEGLKLNDDGTCPNISVYDQYTTLRFKIYKSKKSCKSSFFNLDLKPLPKTLDISLCIHTIFFTLLFLTLNNLVIGPSKKAISTS